MGCLRPRRRRLADADRPAPGIARLASRRLLAGPLLGFALTVAGCATRVGVERLDVARAARIDPDYTGAIVPPNIAPLNFTVLEAGVEFRVQVRGPRGKTFEVSSDTPDITLPAGPWRALLAANRGEPIELRIHARQESGSWQTFAPNPDTVAADSIDGYLVYRLLKPLYNKYVNIGVYQRHLESYDESPILENRHADRACLNCHTFLKSRPDPLVLHTRGRHGLTMLVARGGQVATIETRTAFNKSPAAYTAWHPAGQHICFSVNQVSLFFHSDPTRETREVFDAGSDLALYSLDDNTLTTTPEISRPERAETWPEWSADGRQLYFSSAPVTPIERFQTVRYDLMRIGYDVDSGRWGELEVVLSAAQTGLSILQPKVSPDGRYLVCTMADHGNFPIFLASSDLYAVDLVAGGYRRLEINSEQADSWHSWSSNGRWLVFSSKRRDGLFARPYFSYVDAAGRFHRPLLLPQRDPRFYDSFIQTYNLPVFIRGPVQVSQRALARAVYGPELPLAARLDPQVALALEGATGNEAVTEPYSPGANP